MCDSWECVIIETGKYLGLHMRNNVCWQNHIHQLRRKLPPIAGVMLKLGQELNEKTKLLIFQTLIESRINYWRIVCTCERYNHLKSLQVVQNKALKNIFRLPFAFSTRSLYKGVVQTTPPEYGLHKVICCYTCANLWII